MLFQQTAGRDIPKVANIREQLIRMALKDR